MDRIKRNGIIDTSVDQAKARDQVISRIRSATQTEAGQLAKEKEKEFHRHLLNETKYGNSRIYRWWVDFQATNIIGQTLTGRNAVGEYLGDMKYGLLAFLPNHFITENIRIFTGLITPTYRPQELIMETATKTISRPDNSEPKIKTKATIRNVVYWAVLAFVLYSMATGNISIIEAITHIMALI